MRSNMKDWACSLSGCDGGNISSDLWLCGIEWGGGSTEGYYERDLPREIKNGAVEANLNQFDWKDSLTYTYGRSFAKLYTAINGEKVENYKKLESLSGNEIFKANLYPIAFDSTDHSLWQKYGLNEITGFESKYLFNTWCYFNRFPYFANLRQIHNPKLIVCTGVDYLRDFLLFFGGNANIQSLHSGQITPISDKNKYDRSYYWVNLDSYTLLVVVPFFSGRYGLNSNHLLQEMGERIRILLGEPL